MTLRNLLRRAAVLAAGAAAGAALLTAVPGVSAQADTGKKVGGGSLTISYYDSVDGKEPVRGAEFTCMKIAEASERAEGNRLAASLESLIRGKDGGKIAVGPETAAEEILPDVLEAYRGGVPGGLKRAGRTGQDGKCVIGGLDDGVYLAAETDPAEGHLPSGPFLFSIPSASEEGREVRDLSAEPKASPCGELVIAKEVSGNGGDRRKAFTFEIVLGAEGSFRFEKSDGSSGTIASGGTILLANGQNAVIRGIPAGTVYRVTEREAGQDGYRTDSTGSSGRIGRKVTAKASFINTKYAGYDRVPTPGTGETTGTSVTGPVRTGDASGVLRWAFAACAALLSAAVVMYRNRKGGKTS